MVTFQLTYEHSAISGTIGFKSTNLRMPLKFKGKGTDVQEAGVAKAYDSNRWQQLYKFTATMSGVDYKKLLDFMTPATAPDYTTAYPRFTEVYYSNTLKFTNKEVICTEFDPIQIGRLEGDQAWRVTMSFEEKST